MRWIDIDLPQPGRHPQTDRFFAEAHALLPRIHEIQGRDGLDARTVIDHMAEVGRKLFQGIQAARPNAFSCDASRPTTEMPKLDQVEHDALVGFHLVADDRHLTLPWGWAHNGLGFLLERHPLCAGQFPSGPPDPASARPWMQRLIRSGFLVGRNGETSLAAICDQVAPPQRLKPEILFVPGHTDERIRRLIFREAEIIAQVLAGGRLGRPLARLHVPDGAVTPDALAAKGLAYQAIHYAGPTSASTQYDASRGQDWVELLMGEASTGVGQEVESLLGMEREVLGVDPITSLLDDISERFENRGTAMVPAAAARAGKDDTRRGPGRTRPHPAQPWGDAPGSRAWLLEDGPVDPERFEMAGGIPPLVFSNSYCSLPTLGRRFTAAGASAFIGPSVPVFSRPARSFAGHLYAALGDGWCAGAALWKAAAACRQSMGPEHPAWLSYGVLGYGSLALQYL